MEISANAVREAPETNAIPEFAEAMTREVDENTAAGGSVGDPVKATDGDDDVLTYTLSGGADKDAFSIDAATGQIKVGDGTKLNFESDKRTYEVEVMAADAFGATATVMVIITVKDVDEPPTTPASSLTTPRLPSRMTRRPTSWSRRTCLRARQSGR